MELNLRERNAGPDEAVNVADCMTFNTTITFLNLDTNNLEDKGAVKIAQCLLTNTTLTSLDLASNKIGNEGVTSIALNLIHNSTLSDLNLANNEFGGKGFREICECLKVNTTLTKLNLSSNHIGKDDDIDIFAQSLKSNCHLREINFQNCQIGDQGAIHLLELILGNSNITNLDLQGNNIEVEIETKIKEFIVWSKPDKIKSIRSIDLKDFSLKRVPKGLFSFIGLEWLDLSINHIESLPVEMSNLNRLKMLRLSFNNFQRIPMVLSSMLSLQRIELQGNPFISLVERQLEQITDANRIRQYLIDAKHGSRIWPESKVLILGQEASGKTSLARKLQGKPNEQTLSTEGIELGVIKFVNDHKELVLACLWDFAGQEVFYSTHSIFMSSIGIYLVVWSVYDSASLSRVSFWLNSIRNSMEHQYQCDLKQVKVIGVVTHVNCDQAIEMAQQQANHLTENYQDMVIEYFAVDSMSGKGIQELKDRIGQVCNDQRALREVPGSYVIISELLQDERILKKMTHCSFDEAMQICETVVNGDEGLMKRALEFAHNMGRIVFINKAPLDRLVIVDCNWLIDSMKSIVTFSHTFGKRDGKLTKHELDQLWRSKFPPNTHENLIGILSSFDIIHEIRHKSNQPPPSQPKAEEKQYFVPLLIQSDRQYIDENEMFERQSFFCSTSDLSIITKKTRMPVIERHFEVRFVPAGLMGRLMAGLVDQFEMIQIWKTGCLADSIQSKCRLLIELISPINQQQDQQSTTKEYIRLVFGSKSKVTKQQQSQVINQLRQVVQRIELMLKSWFNVLETKYCVDRQSTNINNRLAMEQVMECFALGNRTILIGGKYTEIGDLEPDLILKDLQEYRIEGKNIKIDKYLAEGSFGQVFSATFNNQKVAVKTIKPSLESEKSLGEIAEEFSQECLMMIQLNHTNLVKCIGFGYGQLQLPTKFDSKKSSTSSDMNESEVLFVVMELIEGGSLNDLLNDPFGLLSTLQKYNEAIDQINLSKMLKRPQKEIEELERKRKEIESKLIEKSQEINLKPLVNATIVRTNQFLIDRARESYDKYKQAVDKLANEYKDKYINQKLDNKQIIDLAVKIAKAINFLHSRKPPVIHRDLKSENVMISGDFERMIINEVKVADLGLATFMHHHLKAIENPIGTIPFIAPEIIDGRQSYSTQSDVYSFAIVMWELINRGKSPYDQFKGGFRMEQIKQAVKSGERPLIDEDKVRKDEWMKEYVSVMKQCWQQQADKRPTIHQTLIKLIELQRMIDPRSADENTKIATPSSVAMLMRNFSGLSNQKSIPSIQKLSIIDIFESTFNSNVTLNWKKSKEIEIGIRVLSVTATIDSQLCIIRVWCFGKHDCWALFNCSIDGRLIDDKPLISFEKEDKILDHNSSIFDSGAGLLVISSDGTVSKVSIERYKHFNSTLTGKLKMWFIFNYDARFVRHNSQTKLIYRDTSNTRQYEIIIDPTHYPPASRIEGKSNKFSVRCAVQQKDFHFEVVTETNHTNEQLTKLRDEWILEICQSAAGRGSDRIQFEAKYKSGLHKPLFMSIDIHGNHWLSNGNPNILLFSPRNINPCMIHVGKAKNKRGKVMEIKNPGVMFLQSCVELKLMLVGISNVMVAFDVFQNAEIEKQTPVIVCELDSDLLGVCKLSINEHGVLMIVATQKRKFEVVLIQRQADGQITSTCQPIQFSWPIKLDTHVRLSCMCYWNSSLWVGCDDGNVFECLMDGWHETFAFKRAGAHQRSVRAICGVGKQVWTFSDDGLVLIWKYE